MEMWQLQQRQGLNLECKEKMSKERIKTFNTKFDGQIYVCYSGGKDSTVLLHLVRSIFPDTLGVCVGTEPPENMELVKSTDNCKILYPDKPMNKVIEEYGYPIISKEVSKCVSRFRNTKSQKMKEYYLHGSKGKKMGVIPKKWRFLINAPFKISEKCCEICKKKPLKRFEKDSGLKPIIGIMASDSEKRKTEYLRKGCNVLEGKSIQSNPMAFWTDKDVWAYIKKYNLKYSKWYDMGYKRSGCFQCLFGIHLEKEPNRIQMMSKTHPKLYDYCINKLHYDEVLGFLNIPYTIKDKQETLL